MCGAKWKLNLSIHLQTSVPIQPKTGQLLQTVWEILIPGPQSAWAPYFGPNLGCRKQQRASSLFRGCLRCSQGKYPNSRSRLSTPRLEPRSLSNVMQKTIIEKVSRNLRWKSRRYITIAGNVFLARWDILYHKRRGPIRSPWIFQHIRERNLVCLV